MIMRGRYIALYVGLTAMLCTPSLAYCCPFCSAVSMTFCEEIGQADAAVIARLIKLPPQSTDPAQNATATLQPAQFEFVELLKGTELVGTKKHFETLYFGSEQVGKEFLVTAIEEQSKLVWATPIPITPPVKPYLQRALALPKEGADRLAFFQDYFESSNEMLARDAYDEFAKAPYQDVINLKDRMKHDQLVEWIKDPKVTPSHRKLYLTMLGVCGTDQDIPMMEAMIKDDSPAGKPGMDALVAAYLKLKGPDGVALIEDLFFKNKDAEYVETYAVIMALRFMGQEEKIVPRQRLIEALRWMLERPDLADQVIPDLARWEDWGSMDKLVQLFKDSVANDSDANPGNDSSWIRVPVINYLRACPMPQARQHLDELAKIDPESVKRANSFFPFGAGAPAATSGGKKDPSTLSSEQSPSDKSDSPDVAPSTETKAGPAANDIPDASKFVDPKERAAVEVRKTNAAQSHAPQATASRVGAAAALLGPKASGSDRSELSTRNVLGGMALVGVAIFALMIAIVRGGQHMAAS